MRASNVMLELKGIRKAYQAHKPILDGIHLTLKAEERLAITGASGQGKSTLLQIIGLLDVSYDGDYWLEGVLTKNLSKAQLARYRNEYFGFIFQKFLFVNHLTVVHNIALPLLYQGEAWPIAKRQAFALLEEFSMLNLAYRFPLSLSGGQQQRVTVLRALIHKPRCLLMDEPTSQLDYATQEKQMAFVMDYQQRLKCGLIIVTHDERIASLCHHQKDLT